MKLIKIHRLYYLTGAEAAIISAGAQAAGAAVNTGATFIARKQNYRYNEKLAQNADQRTRLLYKDFYSPEAMLEQYKKAGLSPSLMYQSGGTIGQSTPAGAQGAGINQQAPYLPIENFADTTLKLAQAKNLEEDTRGKKIDNDVQNEFAAQQAAADLAATLADNGLKEASTAAINLQNIMQTMQNENYAEFGRDKEMYDTYRLKLATFNLYEELQQNQYKTEFDRRTLENKIQKVHEELQNTINDNLLKIAQAHLAEAQTEAAEEQAQLFAAEVEEIGNRISQKWIELGIYEKTQQEQQNWLREQANEAIAKAKEADARASLFKKEEEFVEYKAKTERIDTIWRNVNNSVREARELGDCIASYVMNAGIGRIGKTSSTTYERGTRQKYNAETNQIEYEDIWQPTRRTETIRTKE